MNIFSHTKYWASEISQNDKILTDWNSLLSYFAKSIWQQHNSQDGTLNIA